MATNTYIALDKITVGSAVASVTFSSIPSGYTDLVIVGNLGTTSGSANIALQVGNGSIDTGSNYSFTNVNGDGSSAASSRVSSTAQIYIDYSAYATTTLTSTYIWQVQNYSNTTTNKTVLGRSNTASRGTNATVGLWRSTAAINTIKLDTQSTTFLAGSTFSLYGIAAEGITAKATGGAIYADSTHWYHVFSSTGTFTPSQTLSCDVLQVAGGGGSGYAYGGGGGAGGLLYTSARSFASAVAHTVTIGAGGNNGTNGSRVGVQGNSSTITGSGFSTLTAVGGGGGGANSGGDVPPTSGGSGGGASVGGSSNVSGGAATSGQGFAGGAGTSGNTGGSGGGGAGAAGTPVVGNQTGANGGIGSSTYSSWGVATGTGVLSSGIYYLAGGGAGSGGTGGLGGGANPLGSGLANTGGGGGSDAGSGAGGSGLTIVRYAK
jgi:hypothetical protein